MYKIKRYFQGVWKQAKMVRWPKKKDLLSAVSVVLVVVAFSAICMMIDDLLISKLLQNLDQAFPTESSSSSEAAIRIIGNLFRF